MLSLVCGQHGIDDEFKVKTTQAIMGFARLNFQTSKTDTDLKIVQFLSEMLRLHIDAISVDRTISELGITSVQLFKLKQALRACLELGSRVFNHNLPN